MINEKILKDCLKQRRSAQRKVYEKMANPLYYTCKRYLQREDEIEDVLAESFYNIFTKLHQLKDLQAFEGWARRIVINKCLQKLKQQVQFTLYLEDTQEDASWSIPPDSHLENEDLLEMVKTLPSGCQTIFQLYVIEGYSHKEIAEKLEISVGTSKSQLNVAKSKLQKMIKTHYFTQTKTP